MPGRERWSRKRHEERLKAFEMKCKQEWEGKFLDMERKLERERAIAQDREAELFKLINQEQIIKLPQEVRRHTVLHSQTMETALCNERDGEMELEHLERKMDDDEHRREMQREQQRQQNIEQQLKEMEQKLEMERDMEQRWEMEEKTQRQWAKRTRELERRLEESRQKEQELWKKVVEKRRVTKKEMMIEMERLTEEKGEERMEVDEEEQQGGGTLLE